MKLTVVLMLLVLPTICCAQFGVGFHQSNLPFIGLNYEIKNRLRPELRLGTDNYFEEISFEGIVAYNFLIKDEYQLYAGVGARVNGFTGLVIPLGLNIYPLAEKQFGFHIELSPIVGDASLLRGSWGIRYRFKKPNKVPLISK